MLALSEPLLLAVRADDKVAAAPAVETQVPTADYILLWRPERLIDHFSLVIPAGAASVQQVFEFFVQIRLVNVFVASAPMMARWPLLHKLIVEAPMHVTEL